MKIFLSSLILVLSLGAFADSKMGMMAPTQMDDLIRGEMSAVTSYNQILKDLKESDERTKLERIRNDHEVAVSKLKTYATKDVKEDTMTTGVWGVFAKTWTAGAKLIGNNAALKALSQGEKHGITEYKEALEDDTVKPEIKQMIRTQFIPKQEEHLNTINSMM